jgi:trans-aconitate methyltransferase
VESSGINYQIGAYKDSRQAKYHDVRLLEMISERHPDFKGSVLDIGCAAGAFIDLMGGRFPHAQYTGFDISEELIEIAKSKRPEENFDFFVGDALKFHVDKEYDIIIASGIMSIFDDFTEPLNHWLSYLSSGGTLYVFGRFNSRDVDTIVKFRSHYSPDEDNAEKLPIWEGGLTSYSIRQVERYLKSLSCGCEFIRFVLPIEIPESLDPIRTYTKITTDGEKLVINGANVIAEHYFLVVDRHNQTKPIHPN